MCGVADVDKFDSTLTKVLKKMNDYVGDEDKCFSVGVASACRCYSDLCNAATHVTVTSYCAVLFMAVTSSLIP